MPANSPDAGRVNWLRYAQLRSWRCLLIVVVGFAVHFPALQGEFIWDDIPLVTDNPLIKSPLFVIEAFRHHLFPGEYSGHYRPVQTLSYIFDYLIWNNDTFGYHLQNVVWHVLGGVLLFLLLQKLLHSLDESTPRFARWNAGNVAWFLALLWVVHPVHSAAVDYIAGRADSLAFCFACGAWLLYLRARELTQIRWRISLFAGAALSAWLSLCSRETGCLWMLVFLLHLFAFDRSIARPARLRVLAGCLTVAALYATVRQLPETRTELVRPIGWSVPTRSALMLRALGDYGELMVYPSRLHVERTVLRPTHVSAGERWRELLASDSLAIAGVAMIGLFVMGMARKGVGQRARIFGVAWFVITYLPTSNLFDMNATVAEHWLYLPSVGVLIFLAGCAIELPIRWSRTVTAAGCVALVLLSIRTVVRSSDWVDPETFFRRTFAAGGSNSRIGVNLAVIYAKRGENAKAEEILRKVLQVSPNYSLARNNLALALRQQGKQSEATVVLESATTQPPADISGYRPTPDAALNLARIRASEQNDGAALEIVDRALHDYPGTWELISLRAQLLGKRDEAAAAQIVEEFASKNWWHFSAAMSLGKICAQRGDLARAAAEFHRAGHLDVHDTESLNAAALVEASQHQFDAACVTQRGAIARQPDQPRQHLLLAELLQKMGRADEAEQSLATVARLRALAQSQVAAN